MMKTSIPNSSPSLTSSEELDLFIEKYNSFSDLKSKWKFLNEISDKNTDLAKKLINKIPFETHTMVLDESTNLDDIFLYLELIYSLNLELSSKLMEYLFILDEEKKDTTPLTLNNECQKYLQKSLDVSNFTDAYTKLNEDNDERKIALFLTDIAIINEEIAKRMLWELFSKFKNSEPKHFLDSLKILKWASEDLFLVISIIGTEKLLQSPSLHDFNKLLSMFIEEDPDLIYPLIIEVPDSKQAIKELIHNSSLEEIVYFFKLIENYSPDYLELLINYNFEENKLITSYNQSELQIKLSFLDFISEYEDSELYKIFVYKNSILLKNLQYQIKKQFNLNLFYQGLVFLNSIDKELSQELLIYIDPKLVTEQILTEEDGSLVVNIFNTIAAINGSYLFYSLQAEFKDFITWLERFLTNIDDLEILALFLVSFQKIFTNTPELPLIITTIIKKLQREENLDDLGAFLGIIGSSEPELLQLILNHLLSHLKLYPTDKIGYLLMATSLYNLETGLGLVHQLASRFSSEYDLKVLRKSFESIILANTKVAEEIVKDKNFDIQVLQKNIIDADLLEKVLFLEALLPIGKEVINELIGNREFTNDFYKKFFALNKPDLIKVISNSNWLNNEMCEEISKFIADKYISSNTSDLEEYYEIIHTSSWSNRKLCKKIINGTSMSDLAEKLELLDKTNPLLDKIITILSEIDSEKAEKLLFDHLQNHR